MVGQCYGLDGVVQYILLVEVRGSHELDGTMQREQKAVKTTPKEQKVGSSMASQLESIVQRQIQMCIKCHCSPCGGVVAV